MTYFLSVEQFGLFAILASIRSFIGLFLVNPIGQYVNRHTHEWFEQKVLIAKLRRYNIYISFVSILSFSIVFLWFFVTSNQAVIHAFIASLAMMCIVFASTWNATLIYLLNMLGFRSSAATLEILTLAGTLAGSIAFCYYSPTGVSWFFGGFLGFSVMAIFALKLIYANQPKQLANLKLELISKNEVLSYCLPLAISTLFLWLYSNGYRLIIDLQMGATALGLFVISFTIASQLWSVVETLAMQFLYPYFYKAISASHNVESKVKSYSDLVNTVIPFYTVILAAMIMVGQPLLALLTDSKFSEANHFWYFAVFFEWFRAVASCLGAGWQIDKNMAKNILPYAASSLLGICSILYLLSMKKDMFLLAWALDASGLALLFFMYTGIKNKIKFRLDAKQNLPIFTLVASVLVVALSTGSEPTSIAYKLSLIAFTSIVAVLILLIVVKHNPAYKRLTSIVL